jgi:hypothetical protein
MRKIIVVSAILIFAIPGVVHSFGSDMNDPLEMIIKLGLPKLEGRFPTYYSKGARDKAEKLETAFVDMNAFFKEKLGIQTHGVLAVLNPDDWSKVSSWPYGMPHLEGEQTVIFMPASSGGMAYQMMVSRKESIPADMLKKHCETYQTTFEEVADTFVDLIGFHELGHVLCAEYRIDPRSSWFSEFVASYFAYSFLSERQPEWKGVFDLLGRPSSTRPKNTTLTDFDLLYTGVDDYGWYQGSFETRIRELYPKMGLQFLKELQRQFPLLTEPEELDKLEKIAPGFQSWARCFLPESSK